MFPLDLLSLLVYLVIAFLFYQYCIIWLLVILYFSESTNNAQKKLRKEHPPRTWLAKSTRLELILSSPSDSRHPNIILSFSQFPKLCEHSALWLISESQSQSMYLEEWRTEDDELAREEGSLQEKKGSRVREEGT